MKYHLLLSIALALSVSLIAQDGNGQQPKADASVERARQLWEMAIAAKGGREKLYTVNYEWLLYKIYLDKKTHLPARISSYAADKPTVELIREDYSDYKEFDGLMMPQVESVNRQKPFRQSFEINPAYDPEVFERVPDMNAGADQWRAKSLNSVRSATAPSPEERFTQEEIRQAISKLADSDENVWQEGKQLLWRAGRSALPELLSAMAKASGAMRLGLAKLVIDADAENEEALAVLQNMVKDRNEDQLIRQYAAFPLIRSDKGIAMLIGFLRDQDVLVRRIAIFACDELTEQNEIPASFNPAVPILEGLLKDRNQIVREMAKEVLGQSRHRLKR